MNRSLQSSPDLLAHLDMRMKPFVDGENEQVENPRDKNEGWIFYKYKCTIAGGRCQKMNGSNRMDDVYTCKHSCLFHRKTFMYFLLPQSSTYCFLQLTAQIDEVQIYSDLCML